jgi:hypothetical protein
MLAAGPDSLKGQRSGIPAAFRPAERAGASASTSTPRATPFIVARYQSCVLGNIADWVEFAAKVVRPSSYLNL